MNIEVGAPLRKSLGHLEAADLLPGYKAILTHGKDSKVRIPIESKLKRIVITLDEQDRFVVISVREEVGGAFWLNLIEQAKRLGIVYAGYYTCHPDVIGRLLSEALQAREEGDTVNQIIQESATIEWFRTRIIECRELRATDLHIEVRGRVASLRIRRDGLLRKWMDCSSNEVTNALAACFTILAEERSRSHAAFNVHAIQSALIPLALPEERVKLRYQSHPAVGGFDVVIRILHDGVASVETMSTLPELGYTSGQVAMLQEALDMSLGGIFIAGVTGSGKTTTLSSMLASLGRSGDRKIISIEDPVEYQVTGVSHLSIQRAGDDVSSLADNPFAPAMLAFLRMDPDVGMFGEIRDAISAQMAYTTIQTGHKLLSTVHATSALGIISRLTSKALGLTRQDICSLEFISALIYQVLVPRNCPDCKVPATQMMSPSQLLPYEQLFGLDPRAFYCASDLGCPSCRPKGLAPTDAGHIGVKGMKVGAEIILPDAQLLAYLITGDDVAARNHWRGQGSASFDQDNMLGKPAWAHTLFDMVNGDVDPYHFERTFGPPNSLVRR